MTKELNFYFFLHVPFCYLYFRNFSFVTASDWLQPSSVWFQDLNPQPLNFESYASTTSPWLLA